MAYWHEPGPYESQEGTMPFTGPVKKGHASICERCGIRKGHHAAKASECPDEFALWDKPGEKYYGYVLEARANIAAMQAATWVDGPLHIKRVGVLHG